MGNVSSSTNDLPATAEEDDTEQELYKKNPIPVYNASVAMEEGNAFLEVSSSQPTEQNRKINNNDDDDDEEHSDDLRDVDDHDEEKATNSDDYFEKLQNETLEAERDSMRKRSDEEESDEEGNKQFVYPTSDTVDEYECQPLEFTQSFEENVVFVRRHGVPSSTFVVARCDTPVVRFCKHIYLLQHREDELIKSYQQSPLPAQSTDEVIVQSVPGILACVSREVLHEIPKFSVPLDDGTEAVVIADDGDPIAEHPENVDVSQKVAPVVILDPCDADFAERKAALDKMQTTNTSTNLLRKIDNKVNYNQLKRFVTRGNRLPYDAKPSPGFSDVSPVLEGEEWFIINRQFYCMWKAFEQVCWGNGNFLMDVNLRLATMQSNAYFLPIGIDRSDGVSYTASQEHAVLEKLFLLYKNTIALESQITTKLAIVRNLCDAVTSKLDAATVKTINDIAGHTATEKQSDALKNLTDAAYLLSNLDAAHKEMDELRKQRTTVLNKI